MFTDASGTRKADSRFVLDRFEPSYVSLRRSGEIAARVRTAQAGLGDCRACPRRCGADRSAGEAGICATRRHARVASAGPHLGEEACLRARNGSGTIFFAGCNLGCVFCQNWDISQGSAGLERTASQIADLMLALQENGCHNINLVTPEHVVPQVIEAVAEAVLRDLSIPIVYNTSAYDSLESLSLLDGFIDIYMPDFKLWTSGSSARYLNAEDYPERAREAILEMHRQVGPLRFGPDGVARRGVLLRHLVVPGFLDETTAILEWLARDVSPDTYVNIMGQYRPENAVGQRAKDGSIRFAEINRRPSDDEMRRAYCVAREAGLWRFDSF